MDLERALHLNNTFIIENQQFIVDRLKEAVGSSSALLTEMGLYIHTLPCGVACLILTFIPELGTVVSNRAIPIILHRQRTVQPRRVSWPLCRGHVSHQNLRIQCVGVLRDGVCVKGATLMEINAFSFGVAVLFEVQPATAVLTYQVPAAYYGNWYGYTLLKYMGKVALNYHGAPDPLRGGRGEMAMAVVAWLHGLRRTSDAVPYLHCARSFFTLKEHCRRSCGPQPRSDGGNAIPRKDTRQDRRRYSTYPCVGCFLRVPTHTAYGGPWANSSLSDGRAHAWTRTRLDRSRDHAHGRSPERHFGATDQAVGESRERAVSQAATRHTSCKGTVPSNGREQTQELHFLEVSPLRRCTFEP